MNLQKFESFYVQIKSNRWYWLFALFCRISLAYAFVVAGLVKIMDERFASGLSELHPMGAYLTALHHTGYYYSFIGYVQVAAAVLLLIPRTVSLGALLYFPVILNICILSFAVRFEGSIITSPLMVLANLFLLVWHYDRLKYLLPLRQFPNSDLFQKPTKYSMRFPWIFSGLVLATVALVFAVVQYGYKLMPRNSLKDCQSQFTNHPQQQAGYSFCECIHLKGKTLDDCLAQFESSKARRLE